MATAASLDKAEIDRTSRETPALPFVGEEALDMGDVARVLKLGRNSTYDLLRAGLPHIRIGRVIRVPRQALMRWLDEQAAAGAALATSRTTARGRRRGGGAS